MEFGWGSVCGRFPRRFMAPPCAILLPRICHGISSFLILEENTHAHTHSASWKNEHSRLTGQGWSDNAELGAVSVERSWSSFIPS